MWFKRGTEEWREAGTNDGCAQGHSRTAVSPLLGPPTSAMSDQHKKKKKKKKQCVRVCSHEQLGGSEKKERKKKVNKGGEGCANSPSSP